MGRSESSYATYDTYDTLDGSTSTDNSTRQFHIPRPSITLPGHQSFAPLRAELNQRLHRLTEREESIEEEMFDTGSEERPRENEVVAEVNVVENRPIGGLSYEYF